MLDQNQINKIKESAQEFFSKMTVEVSKIEASLSSEERSYQDGEKSTSEKKDVINLQVELDDPQILIGKQGQTLFEIQRLLGAILNKGVQKENPQEIFYFNLDINGYKSKKVEYLKSLAKEAADQVVLNKEEKSLPPMSAYERRVVHAELAQREDVLTESQGSDLDRHIVVKPK